MVGIAQELISKRGGIYRFKVEEINPNSEWVGGFYLNESGENVNIGMMKSELEKVSLKPVGVGDNFNLNISQGKLIDVIKVI